MKISKVIIHLFFDFQFLHSKVLISDMENWKDDLFENANNQYWVIGCKKLEKNKYFISETIKQKMFFLKNVFHFIYHFLKISISNKDIVVIVHGGNANLWMPFFFLPKMILKKIRWICWGSQINVNKNHFKGKLYYKIRKVVFNKISAINFLMKSEIDFFLENYYNDNIYFNPYFYSICDSFLKDKNFEKPNNLKKIKTIQIGNNGHSVNNHIDAFIRLKPSRDKYLFKVPLSYGYQKYIDEVSIAGKKYFGNNVLFFYDFLNIEKLIEEFKNTDALVMNSDTQSGLFAIYAYVYFQKPIFLKENCLISNYFDSLKIKYYSISDLNDNFVFDTQLLESNSKIIEQLINSQESFAKWRLFFLQ